MTRFIKINRISVLAAALLIGGLAASAWAQGGPPPPAPIVETEIRENSTEMRARMLEMMKRTRNGRKVSGDSDRERVFREVKHDFEKIQSSLDEIIAVYKTGKRINFSRISQLSDTLVTSSHRLCSNLFEKPEKLSDSKQAVSDSKKAAMVRAKITVLDRLVGEFVSSPIFTSKKTVKTKDVKKARKHLLEIIEQASILRSVSS